MKERPILFSAPMVRAILDGKKTQTRRIVKPQPTEPTAKALRHPPRHPGPYFDAYCSERKIDENPRGMSDRWCWWTADDRPDPLSEIRCPYGMPGNRLWLRETWYCDNTTAPNWNPGKKIEATPELIAEWRESLYFRADAASGTCCELIPECACSEYRTASGRKRSPWRPGIHMPRWASRIDLEVTNVRVERLWSLTDADALAEGVFDEEAGWHKERFRSLWTEINGIESWPSNPWVWVVEFKRVRP